MVLLAENSLTSNTFCVFQVRGVCFFKIPPRLLKKKISGSFLAEQDEKNLPFYVQFFSPQILKNHFFKSFDLKVLLYCF